MADIIPGYRGNTITTSSGKSFINTVMAKMPFAYQIIENITELNPKYELFKDLASDRKNRIDRQSVSKINTLNNNEDGDEVGRTTDHYFKNFMYANLDLDKVKRLHDYRKMSGYSTLADCIDEVCDEVFVEDAEGHVVNIKIEGDYSKIIEEEIKKEWERYIDVFDFKQKGWEYARQIIIDGELYFENIISEEKPEFGILGISRIPTELITPTYSNYQNDTITSFILRKPVVNPKTERMESEQLVVFDDKQITYVHSGMWNEDRTMKLPYIENARRAYKQLSLIEDAIVIYRLVRAPERLAFHVDVGNMSPPKAESYLKRLMQQYWTKKTYDTTTGRTTNVYDPQSMLDSYWFPKRAGTEGTKIERLEGGHNLGQLDDLMFFLRQLYKSMRVPVGRLSPEDTYKDGSEMTREELRFARYLIRIQKQFADALKQSFITHLKLRKMWENWSLRDRHIIVEFNVPTMFMEMKRQQIFELHYNNFNNMSNNEGISNSFAQKKYLGMSDIEMTENREWKRKDAAFQWEVEQILSNGPNWKEQVAAMQQATAEMNGGGGGGGAASGLPADSDTPPQFGAGPETGGEGEQAPPTEAGGEPAGAPAGASPQGNVAPPQAAGGAQTGAPANG